jgi:hypothetical protein
VRIGATGEHDEGKVAHDWTTIRAENGSRRHERRGSQSAALLT